MIDIQYQTISRNSEGFYKEKGSKFIALAYPVHGLTEIKNYIAESKKEYYDARHHCYAYILRDGAQVSHRANDDGEPSHSAGDPILGQLKSFELENVLVIVVRYFGGTKLGVSGLIQAYKAATEKALSSVKFKTVVVKQSIELNYPYDKTNEVMRLVEELDIAIGQQEFNENCVLQGKILPSRLEKLKAKVGLLLGVSIQAL